MSNENGAENGSMSDLVLHGILQIEEVEENGDVLFSLDWDKLREYDEEIYYRFREAEMNSAMVQ